MSQRRGYWVRDRETKKLTHISKVTERSISDCVYGVCDADLHEGGIVYVERGYFLCSCGGLSSSRILLHDFVELALTDGVCEGV